MKALLHSYTKIFVILLLAGCGRDGTAPHGERGHDHGTPEGWTFTLPKGDPAAGREMFVEAECYKCHEVKGEKFPSLEPGDEKIGPELSQMAGAHPLEFFAESIVNPNASIVADAKERGYVEADGRSKMPDFSDVLTVKQVADLAAYIESLGGKGRTAAPHKH